MTNNAAVEWTAKDSGVHKAGLLQGLTLALCSTLPVMGAVLIAPLLPKMAEEFAADPACTYLVPLALTAPALCIAILSPFVGALADSVGRKVLLVWSLVFYAFVGTCPLYLHSLRWLVASRFAVGVAESFIMTCSTTLLGDYFQLEEREKWISYQQALMSLAGLLFVLVGGWLGGFGWRIPFGLYAGSLLFLPLAAVKLWEPKSDPFIPQPKGFPWTRILGIGALTVLGALVFYAVPVELGFLLLRHGVRSSFHVGLSNALISLPIPVGALLFKRLHERIRMRWLLGIPMLFMGLGLVLASRAHSLVGVLLSLSLHQFGGGLMMPTFLTYAMSRLSFEMRGRGTGAWWTSFFVGQFSSALLITFVAQRLGSLSSALGAFGWTCIAVCVITVFLPVWRSNTVTYPD